VPGLTPSLFLLNSRIDCCLFVKVVVTSLLLPFLFKPPPLEVLLGPTQDVVVFFLSRDAV